MRLLNWTRPLLASSWLPAALVTAATATVLHFYGVSIGDLAAFIGYVSLGITLPGTLIWRALTAGHAGTGQRAFAVEAAAGTALGYSIEVLVYLAARAAGAPLAVLSWPVLTIIAFAAVPRLRRHWRGSGPSGRLPRWLAWSLAGLFGLLVIFSATAFFRTNGLGWTGSGTLYIDMPFQIAMVGELRHHMPPQFPYVAGEPLVYHWFVYPEIAATSWVTGIEAQVLVLRLSILPMLAAFLILIVAITRRITGAWWPGVVALVILYLSPAVVPYRWTNGPTPEGSALNLWSTPTQVFGTLLFGAAVLTLIDLIKGARSVARWALFGLLLALLTGARATFLPLLTAGLALAVLVPLLLRRRFDRTTAGALALSAAALLFAQYVLYRGEHYALVLAPLTAIKVSPLAQATGLVGPASPAYHWSMLLVATAIALVALFLPWSGALGLLRRPATLLDPTILTLAGTGIAGVGAMLTFGHPGQSQVYFLTGARPYLAIVAACGLATLLHQATLRRWIWLCAAAIGASGVIIALWYAQSTRVPTRAGSGGTTGLIWALTWPYLVIIGIAVVAGGLLWWRRRGPSLGWASLALVVVALTAYALPLGFIKIGKPIAVAAVHGWHTRTGSAADDGTIAAARWLRDHSSPNDLIATNLHCRYPDRPACDNRHFSVAAFTERRVLIEGWGYTAKAMSEVELFVNTMGTVPYWDPQRMADNDAVFTQPSAAATARLRDDYGVRWLFVDQSAPGVSPALPDFARLVFTAGSCAVYRLD